MVFITVMACLQLTCQSLRRCVSGIKHFVEFLFVGGNCWKHRHQRSPTCLITTNDIKNINNKRFPMSKCYFSPFLRYILIPSISVKTSGSNSDWSCEYLISSQLSPNRLLSKIQKPLQGDGKCSSTTSSSSAVICLPTAATTSAVTRSYPLRSLNFSTWTSNDS